MFINFFNSIASLLAEKDLEHVSQLTLKET